MQDDRRFLTVARYVEANAVRAKLAERAEDWPWGSSAERPVPLAAWPVRHPPDWTKRVNQPLDESRLAAAAARHAVKRGLPLRRRRVGLANGGGHGP